MKHRRAKELTLWLSKVTLLLARRDGTIDVVSESSLADVADLVVGLDVLLDGLTAVRQLVYAEASCDASDM